MNELTALVIDDIPDIAELFSYFLIDKGVRTDTVGTTAEGLGKLTQQIYDIVITDLNQKPTGIDVYKAAVSIGVPDVYIVTGGAEGSLMTEAKQVAGEHLLIKPIEIEVIHRIIDKAKERKPQS